MPTRSTVRSLLQMRIARKRSDDPPPRERCAKRLNKRKLETDGQDLLALAPTAFRKRIQYALEKGQGDAETLVRCRP